MSRKVIFSLVVVLVAIYVYYYQETNSSSSPHLLNDIEIISNDKTVEKHLNRYREVIGKDYEGYKGHIYRVLTYSLHFLPNLSKKEKERTRKVIAAGLVFHDIGLWTDHTLAYLEPSVQRAEEYFNYKSFTKEEFQLIKDIIFWHHKITPFKGENEDIVNAVIKADLIDASNGIITKGMPKSHIKKVTDTIPEAGFHQTLMEFGPRLHGWNVVKIVTDLSSILRW
jgi:hypothetical protein